MEDIVLPGRHLLIESEAGLFDVSETASEAWSTDVVTSDTERMAEVDTDEASSVARSEADSEQDSSSSVLAIATAGSSHLGAIQRIRGRMSGSGSLFRPIREVSVEQVQNLSLQPRNNSTAQPEAAASSASNGPMSSSSSSCSSHGSIASSAKGLANSAAAAALAQTTSTSTSTTASTGPIGNQVQPSSTGAIPKSISFDKTADRGDKDQPDKQRGFFRSFKLPFKRGGRTKDRVSVDHVDNVNTYANVNNRSLRRSASEEARTAAAAIESSDDILAKYRNKTSSTQQLQSGESVVTNGASIVAFNLAEEQSAEEDDEEEDDRQHIDPMNVESSYAFADAKRKLRLVLSTADVQSLHVMNNASAASNNTEHELIIFLKLQLAEAINLQDRSLVAQLHETLRCVRLFDATGCSKLFQSLQEDYKTRSPYLSYLIQCRQSLLSVLAHLERLANRVEQDKAVCHRFLISVCVRLFLEKREKELDDFVVEFQLLNVADEKADWLESFLHRLSGELERDAMWQSASAYQMELALTAVEQRLMALIYNYALYPNGDGDVSRDQVLYFLTRLISCN